MDPETIIHSIHQTWIKYSNLLPGGYKVFYGPYERHPLLIIGFNPGGNAKDFIPHLYPPEHEYLTHDYVMARQMRYYLDPRIIGKSVKTNILFFRTSNVQEWNAVPASRRKELEAICASHVSSIIDDMKPTTILAEGIATYRAMKKLLNLQNKSHEEVEYRLEAGKRVLVYKTENLIGIIHPTGARLSRLERQFTKETLAVLIPLPIDRQVE